MSRGPFIVSRAYDWTWFLGAPMLALLVGILVSGTPLANDEYQLWAENDTLVGFFIGTVIQAHLVAVLFRSHGNRDIRALYPIRFFVVPVVLWAAIIALGGGVALGLVFKTK